MNKSRLVDALRRLFVYLASGRFLKDLISYFLFEKRVYKATRRRIYNEAVQQGLQRNLLTPLQVIQGRLEIQKALEHHLQKIAAEFNLKPEGRNAEYPWGDYSTEIAELAIHIVSHYPPSLAALILDLALDPLPPFEGRINQGFVVAIVETLENMVEIEPAYARNAARILVRTMSLDPYQSPYSLYKRIVHFLPLEDEKYLPMARLVTEAFAELNPRVAAILWRHLDADTQRRLMEC